MTLLKRCLPFLSWFEGYTPETLRSDLLSGLTVALVLVPQSMAYAQLAGLPAYYGLYASFLPPIVASLFGSSRQLATGPVAVVSLMTAAALEPLATAGSEQYVAYAILLALMVGAFQFLLGVLRLGLIVNFLSHPVVNGFTNAAAIIIATSQLAKIFGVQVDKGPSHFGTVYRVLQSAVEFTHWPTVMMAILALAIMLTLRRVAPRVPNVLVAVVVTTAAAWAIGFERTEMIEVAQIKSEQVVSLIARFNDAIAGRERLEHFRGEARDTWNELSSEQSALCSRCHATRDVDGLDSAFAVPSEEQELRDGVLTLHGIAGVLEAQIYEPKRIIMSHRAELRRFVFVRAPGSDGRAHFFVRDQVGEDFAADNTAWRLVVGNGPLESGAVKMTGGGSVVGAIPEGLPSLRAPELDWSVIPQLLAAAVIVSLLGFMEAISIARAMTARTRQKLDPNQELIGQGLANIVGCLGQGYPVSGSFSRSAVNLQAGARTGLSNVFSGVVVMITLLFLSKWLYHLPQAVLASIIMMAVLGLISAGGFVHVWNTSRLDGVVAVSTFAGTLALAPHLEWGIFIGVALSIGAYLYRTMRPEVVELAPHPDGSIRGAERHALKKCRHIAVISFDGPLNFASTSYLEGEILNRLAEVPELRHILLAADGISEIDASGVDTLRSLVDNLRGAGHKISFSGVSDAVLDVLRRSRLLERIGEDCFHPTVERAVSRVYASSHVDSAETDCPFRQALPEVVELSLHPDGSLRSAEAHGLKVCRHIAAIRFDGPLSFANTALLEQEILGRLRKRSAVRHVLFVAHGIGRIDEQGAARVGELVRKLRGEGLAVAFSGLKDDLLEALAQADVLEAIGRENIYPTQVGAIAAIFASAHLGSSEGHCPLEALAPRLTELSLYDDGSLREAERYRLQVCERMAVLRLDGTMEWATAKALQCEFIRWAKLRPTAVTVIMVASALPRVDAGLIETLLAFVEEVREAGYRIAIAGVTDAAAEKLGRSGAADVIGLENIYATGRMAVTDLHPTAHQDCHEERCPLEEVMPRAIELSLHADGSLRSAQRHGLRLCRTIAAIRFEGPLNFATIGHFERELGVILSRRPETTHILIALHALSRLDPDAADKLPLVLGRLADAGYEIAISGLRSKAITLLRGAAERGVLKRIAVYATQSQAIEAIHAAAHQGEAEEPCPLQLVSHVSEDEQSSGSDWNSPPRSPRPARPRRLL